MLSRLVGSRYKNCLFSATRQPLRSNIAVFPPREMIMVSILKSLVNIMINSSLSFRPFAAQSLFYFGKFFRLATPKLSKNAPNLLNERPHFAQKCCEKA